MAEAPSVLLVGEDDTPEMYASFLALQGIDAVISRSPVDAITHLSATHPAVVVTELAFGRSVSAGCDFITATRQHLPSPIVIVVTGFGRAEDRALARRCGADRFFTKPFLPGALLREVQSALVCVAEGRRPDWNDPPPAW